MNIKITLFFLLAAFLGTPILHAMETSQPDPKTYTHVSHSCAATLNQMIKEAESPSIGISQVQTLLALANVHRDPEGQLKEAIKNRDVDKARLSFQSLPKDQPIFSLHEAIRDYKEKDAEFLLQFTDASYFYIRKVDDKTAREGDPRIQAAPITIHFRWQDDPENQDKYPLYSFWATYGMTKLLLQSGCKFGTEYMFRGNKYSSENQNVQHILNLALEREDFDYCKELIHRTPDTQLHSLRDAIWRDDLVKAKFCLQNLSKQKVFVNDKGQCCLLARRTDNLALDCDYASFWRLLGSPSYKMAQLLFHQSNCRNELIFLARNELIFLARMASENEDSRYYKEIVQRCQSIENNLWTEAINKDDTPKAVFIFQNRSHRLEYYNQAGSSALHRVAKRGNRLLTDLLIKGGANVEATTRAGVPVLRVAKGEARQRLKQEIAERKWAAVSSILSICPHFPPLLMMQLLFGDPEQVVNPLYKPTPPKKRKRKMLRQEKKEEETAQLADGDKLLAARGTKTKSAPTRTPKKYRPSPQ